MDVLLSSRLSFREVEISSSFRTSLFSPKYSTSLNDSDLNARGDVVQDARILMANL